jgi:RNase P/RNase MRP subunit p29
MYGPTEVELETEFQAICYVSEMKIIMGKMFVVEQDGKTVKMKRPALVNFHEMVMKKIKDWRTPKDVQKPEKKLSFPEMVGRRVYAVRDADGDQVRLFGFGIFEGEETVSLETKGVSQMVGGDLNPKIKLDDGQTVWGCECWWGPEERFEREFGGKEVVKVDINAFRLECTGEIN